MPALSGLRPFHCGGRLIGAAFTVRAGDNLPIHQALEVARRGDVIVVDGWGDTSRALVGDILVGDADGVVTFPPAVAPTLRDAVRAQADREAEVLALIRAGRYDGRYARASSG